jgi:hypothetical protein
MPAATATNGTPSKAAQSCGRDTLTVLPVQHWPCKFHPQQKSWPELAAMAALWQAPAATCTQCPQQQQQQQQQQQGTQSLSATEWCSKDQAHWRALRVAIMPGAVHAVWASGPSRHERVGILEKVNINQISDFRCMAGMNSL